MIIAYRFIFISIVHYDVLINIHFIDFTWIQADEIGLDLKRNSEAVNRWNKERKDMNFLENLIKQCFDFKLLSLLLVMIWVWFQCIKVWFTSPLKVFWVKMSHHSVQNKYLYTSLPGIRRLVKPLLCPTPKTSSKGQNSTSLTVSPPKREVM